MTLWGHEDLSFSPSNTDPALDYLALLVLTIPKTNSHILLYSYRY